jgi:tartrate-resistant acid phosphatase type 5
MTQKLLRLAPVCLIVLALAARGFAENPATAPSTQPCVSLMAMGDWGDGSAGQKKVAGELATIVSEQTEPVDAMLLAGDNFYVPLSGTQDPAWKNLFENMYDPKRLAIPFYVSLGNHDYPPAKAQIELDYAKQHPDSRWKLPAHWYAVDFPADHPIVRLLVLDSNKDPMPPDQWMNEFFWIDKELAQTPPGVWTIAMAHHPIYSNGAHGDNGVLMTSWGKIFKDRNLDFYLCGHDHDLQHLEMPGWHTSFVLVGGGGRTLTAMRRDNRGPFSRSVMGFANLTFTADKATVTYYDSTGKILHQFEKSRDGKVTILENSPSDKATPDQLKAIQYGG